MSRLSSSQPVTVRPQNNVFTGLAAAAVVLAALALFSLFLRAGEVFPGGLFGGGQ